MTVQYLVGLCCLRANPEAVEITLGDLVHDTAAAKRRDVDVTVALTTVEGERAAFKAFEVKREAHPLDVGVVEQLCQKLRDMPDLTHRAIVSSSGFTDGSVNKARAHGIDLYALKPWTAPLHQQFPAFEGVGPPHQFLPLVESQLLCWKEWEIFLHAAGPSFRWDDSMTITQTDGAPHKEFPRMALYRDALLLRSTATLFGLAQGSGDTIPISSPVEATAEEASPGLRHSHTLDAKEDGVWLNLESGRRHILAATVTGRLYWKREQQTPAFRVMERVPGGEPFAGAAIAPWGTPDGRLLALVFSPTSREVGIHSIVLLPKHINAIRELVVARAGAPL